MKFDAKIKGSLIAEAGGYFEYQVLWIFGTSSASSRSASGRWPRRAGREGEHQARARGCRSTSSRGSAS